MFIIKYAFPSAQGLCLAINVGRRICLIRFFYLIFKHIISIFYDAYERKMAMKRIFFLSFCIVTIARVNAQDFSADKLIDMLSLTGPKLQNLLLSKKYHSSETEYFGDTAVTMYQTIPVISFNKKKQADSENRKFTRSVLKETFIHTYQTTSAAEYGNIIKALKKKGFYCEYEKDSTLSPAAYLYQHEDYTAEASIKREEDTAWYSITFYKKIFPGGKGLYFAEDLLQFTSHEYLVYYFGAKNVIKDIYYFGGNDIAKCSVLLINSKRQVIFIWRDGINRRKISNLIFGGQHKLKSQEGKDSITAEKGRDSIIAENSWLLKSGIHAGMSLFDLREVNKKNIAFCGGNAPNPGLVFPESTGKVDFKNNDVILSCMNCNDDKFLSAKIMYADKAMKDGRIFFILTIVLYPGENGIFE